jgi:5-oxoprolinase (ATP-hydrolysing)
MRGTDTALEVLLPESGDWRGAFDALHRDRFGYVRPGRAIEIHAIRLRVVGEENRFGPDRAVPTDAGSGRPSAETGDDAVDGADAAAPGADLVSGKRLRRGPGLPPGSARARPASRGVRPLVLEANATVVIDPGFGLEVDGDSGAADLG